MIGKKILKGIAGTSILAILIFGCINIVSYLQMQKSLTQQYTQKSGELYEKYQQSMEKINTDSIRTITDSYQEYIQTELGTHVKRLTLAKQYLEEIYANQVETYSNLIPEQYYLQPGVNPEQIEDEFKVIKGVSDMLFLNSRLQFDSNAYYVTESGMLLAGMEVDYANSSPENDRRERDWYQETKKSGTLYWKEAYVDNWSKNKIVTCAQPVLGADGSLKGVLAEDISISYIEDILKESNHRLVKYAYVCDKKGKIFLSSNDKIDPAGDIGQEEYGHYMKEVLSADGSGVHIGQDFMAGYSKIDTTEWYVCVVLDYEQVVAASKEIQSSIDSFSSAQEKILAAHLKNLLILSVVIFLVLLAAVLLASRKISNSLARPLQLLTKQAERIGKGELDNQLSGFDSDDEVGILAATLGTMTTELKQYIQNLSEVTADKERIATELSIATQIQGSMLPCIFPPYPEREEFDVFASMSPAKEVGGDFYDFFLIDPERLCVVIADVSGKGVPAALFMVIAKTLIKNQAGIMSDIGKVFETVNNQLCENNEAVMFVTAFMGILNVKTGVFEYVNAGHNPPLLKQGAQNYNWLPVESSFILAGMEGVTYQKQEILMSTGDTLFLYTDGVTEAADCQFELYGEERLQRLLNQEDIKEKPIGGIAASVKEDIALFVGEAQQNDDITMLVLKMK